MQKVKNNPRNILLFFTVLLSLILSACESGPRVKMAPGYEATAVKTQVEANVMGTPEITQVPPTPTPEPLVLDNNPYSLSSKALTLYIPQGWVLKQESKDYAMFESPDGKAWFEALVESTGYELSGESFQNYLTEFMDHSYMNAKGYERVSSQINSGQAAFVSSYQKNDVAWYVYDFFIQRYQAIYLLSFQAMDEVKEAYLPGFQEVVDRAETFSAFINIDEDRYILYHHMTSYIAPSNVFSLSLPLGWSFSRDKEGMENAVIDMDISPDREATVEVITYSDEQVIASQDIGQTAIGIMKRLDGKNLSIYNTNVLDDGRIRLDWRDSRNGINGFTFFWRADQNLYILTFKYNKNHSTMYEKVLENIGDSYRSPAVTN